MASDAGRDRRFGASLADLSSPSGDVAFAGVAADQMLHPASVPKVAALGTVFQFCSDVRAGKIALS